MLLVGKTVEVLLWGKEKYERRYNMAELLGIITSIKNLWRIHMKIFIYL